MPPQAQPHSLPFSISLLHSPRQNSFCFHVSRNVSQWSENRYTTLLSYSIPGCIAETLEHQHSLKHCSQQQGDRPKVIVHQQRDKERKYGIDPGLPLHLPKTTDSDEWVVLSPCPLAGGEAWPGRKCGVVWERNRRGKTRQCERQSSLLFKFTGFFDVITAFSSLPSNPP